MGFLNTEIFFFILALSKLSNSFVFDPTRFTRSHAAKNNDEPNPVTEPGRHLDKEEWLHGRSIKLGNVSVSDFAAIIDSVKNMARPESPKFPRIEVYDYYFKDDSREVLLYVDPDEGKQWIVNIEDLDLRQNLLVFRLGDLGFGFRKENTYVVLRKSMQNANPFHFFHLAYIQPKRKGSVQQKVEWDNIKPKDLLPIPMIFNEPQEDHEEHCNPRICGLKEWIFGTCAIVKLSCKDINELPLNGHDKERIYVMIREKQPFLYDVVRSLSINKGYLHHITQMSRSHHQPTETKDVRKKREIQSNQAENQRLNIDDDPNAAKYSPAVSSSSTDNQPNKHGDKLTPKDLRIDNNQAPASFQHDLLGGDESRNVHEHHSEHRSPFDSQDGAFSADKELAEASKYSMDDNVKVLIAEESSPDLKRIQRKDQIEEVTETEQSTGKSGPTREEVSNVKSTEEPPRETDKIPIQTLPKQDDQASDYPDNSNDNDEKNKNNDRSNSDQDYVEIEESPNPSSFDLLLMKNKQDGSMVHENVSYFGSILKKIRRDRPSKYTTRLFECAGCEPMGTFFSDFEDDMNVSPVVYNVIADIFQSAPVDELFSTEAQEMLQEHTMVPFVGYGSCDYSVDVLDKAPKSEELDDIIDYYAETLSENCEKRDLESQRPKTRMRELLTSKHHLLEITPDMSVKLNKSSQLPKHAILSTNEFRQFMVSLIFSAYTTEYRLEGLRRVSSSISDSLPNHNQSHQMKFLTRVILRVLDELVKSFSQHLIKGLRYLLQILEDKFFSLVVEHFGVMDFNFKGNEKERTVYKLINRNDRLQVLALEDFIINGGVSPVRRSGTDSVSAFRTFFVKNRKRVSNALLAYGVDSHEEMLKLKSPEENLREARLEFDVFGHSSKEISESDEEASDVPVAIETEFEESTFNGGARGNIIKGKHSKDQRYRDWDILE